MKAKKLTKKQIEAREAKIDKLRIIMVNTFDGKKSLYDLCMKVGIKHRTSYYSMVEYKRRKGESVNFALEQPPVKKVHDYGFVFKNGFEINGVSRTNWKLFDFDNVEIYKRNDCK